ncbi:TetR/AcrR family transcriptional regulator [Elongatibacter sediminis]|uniref:TetR/AcrR family transcriptional regulator n=1 Tax=Elongatibacter sediminis TaxID=3119006 RepID=A0AAW9R4K1_9GAMM
MATSNTAEATPKTTRKGRRPARERIFEAAKELFYLNGIRAVGVEGIAAEAGTTKMSLYRSFQSKDELVAECLRDHQNEFWAWWDDAVAPHEGDPKAQLFALIDAFQMASCASTSHGCPLANAIVEINDDEHPGRQVITEHKNEFRRRLRALSHEMGAQDPDQLGDALMLLIEGSYVCQLIFDRSDCPIDSLYWSVRTLVDAHIDGD